MEVKKIAELLSDKISGEWGEEGSLSGTTVNVIRTANFTNSGAISFDEIVKRDIEPLKVERKKLLDGDIIIEKSGGSPSQPVGRVVYFENPDKAVYLCNNFTTVLRPRKETISPKYLFYLLQNNYKTRKVLEFQNKTTGIINLKLDRYLESTINFEPDLETQNKIVAVLDKAKSVLDKRERTIAMYDELLRATFLDMFGNPMERPNRWVIDRIGNYVNDITAGTSYGGENKKALESDELGVLKVSAVTRGVFDPLEYKAVKRHLIRKEVTTPKRGDLLFSRANTLELVGATCIVDQDYEDLILPDKLWRVETDEENLRKVYLHYVLRNKDVRRNFLSIATGSSGSMLNISMDKFKAIEIPVPPIDLQMRFEKLYFKYVEIREQLLRSFKLLHNFNSALSDLAFSGKLTLQSGIDLEVLLEWDYSFFQENLNNITEITISQLIDRLEKGDENKQKFYESAIYDKVKSFLFELLKEGKVQQTFDRETQSVKLAVA